jgi:hypothetical protein
MAVAVIRYRAYLKLCVGQLKDEAEICKLPKSSSVHDYMVL